MHLPRIPTSPRLWTSFRPEDAELLAADGDARRICGKTPLVVRLWGTEILYVRVTRDEIRLTPALLQWRHDGAHAVPIANVSTYLTPSSMLATRAGDLAVPDCALTYLLAALDEALGETAQIRTRALLALARLRLAEANLPYGVLRISPGGRPRLDAALRRPIPLAHGRHAGSVLKRLWSPSDRLASLDAAVPVSPFLPFASVAGLGITCPDVSSAHQRLALVEAARPAAAAAGVDPAHLDLWARSPPWTSAVSSIALRASRYRRPLAS